MEMPWKFAEADTQETQQTHIASSEFGTSSFLTQTYSGLGLSGCNDEDESLIRSDIMFIAEIGQGGFSRVFSGILYGDYQVAIKEVQPKVRRGLFVAKNEVRILSEIEHEHIVCLFGCLLAGGPLWIVMELCSGGSCHDLLHCHKDVEISWLQKCKMCQDVAFAMEFLHTRTPKIVHRDLKSPNVLLKLPLGRQELPQMKVADFGLSCYLRSDGECPQERVGTLRWRAPELQACSRYNEKVDVFSYGMVLYEFILRTLPFQGAEQHVLRGHVEAGETPDIRGVSKACPEALRTVMLACWTYDPEHRPSFASDIVPALSCRLVPKRIISL